MAAPTHLAHVTGRSDSNRARRRARCSDAGAAGAAARTRSDLAGAVATARRRRIRNRRKGRRRHGGRLQRLANALVEVNLEARQLRSEIDASRANAPSDMPSPGAIKRLEAARGLHDGAAAAAHARTRHRRSCSRGPAPAGASAAPAPAAAKRAADGAATAHAAALPRALGKPLAVAPDGGRRRGTLASAENMAMQAARAGDERDLATSRAALEHAPRRQRRAAGGARRDDNTSTPPRRACRG